MNVFTVGNLKASTKATFARQIINAQKGKFFTVVFNSKTDGSEKVINGRDGVFKYSNGGVNNIANKVDLVSVFNVKKMAYRAINLEGVKEIRASNMVVKFED
jgi:hypothetical protein